MDIKKISYHGHQFFTVKNNVGLEITFCSYGASIYNIKFHNKTVTYHPGSFKNFLDNYKFYGKLLGRVCGRIKDGIIKVDKKIYHLDKTEGNNTLHGGKKCLSFQDFEAFFSESEELINIVFKYTSPNLECGFPGDVRFVIVYNIMKNKNKFSINFHAVPQQATPLNLTTHIYWRLLDKDVLDHRLTINANEITKFDDQLIACGKMHASKIYSFREEKRIGMDIKAVKEDNPRANGYDCGYIFNKMGEHQVILRNAGIKLTTKTDMSMVNIYTNCYANKDLIKDYGLDKVYGGIAIEPQMFYTDINEIIVTPEKPFNHFISFELENY